MFDDKLDFSGYDRTLWQPRSLTEHHRLASLDKNANTKQEQKNFIFENGLRYSVLLRLPYFDLVRMHVIDPMHNLLLGTGKHMMEVWTEHDILNKQNFRKLEDIVSNINTLKSVGHLPVKIGSSFAGFSADQWRNWTTVFSPVAQKGVIHSFELLANVC